MENYFCSHCGAYAEQSYAMKKRYKFRIPKQINLCLGCFFAYRARYEVQGYQIAEDVIMSKQ